MAVQAVVAIQVVVAVGEAEALVLALTSVVASAVGL